MWHNYKIKVFGTWKRVEVRFRQYGHKNVTLVLTYK